MTCPITGDVDLDLLVSWFLLGFSTVNLSFVIGKYLGEILWDLEVFTH